MRGFMIWLSCGPSLQEFLSLEHGAGTKGGIGIQGATWKGCFDLQGLFSCMLQNTLGDKWLQQLCEEVIIQNSVLQQIFRQLLYRQFRVGVKMKQNGSLKGAHSQLKNTPLTCEGDLT